MYALFISVRIIYSFCFTSEKERHTSQTQWVRNDGHLKCEVMKVLAVSGSSDIASSTSKRICPTARLYDTQRNSNKAAIAQGTDVYGQDTIVRSPSQAG